MRYLVVFVAIGLTAADEGPCFSHVDVSEKSKSMCRKDVEMWPMMLIFIYAGQLCQQFWVEYWQL